MENDRIAIQMHLSTFREKGIVQHRRTLLIPFSERIPALLQRPDGKMHVLTALTASIHSALKNLNLKVPMDEEQIVELADSIIDSSYEDQLGLEDVLLFLSDMLKGKYGKIYERMDMQVFFEMFENYREARHQEVLNVRYEQHAQTKVQGRDNKPLIPVGDSEDTSTLFELMQDLYSEPKEGEE